MSADAVTIERTPVSISADNVVLQGDLAMPPVPKGIVLFAHGSGSSRQSPRNLYVANVLNESSLGTLLADLLTVDEEREDEITSHLRFDIDLLTRRLTAITDWLSNRAQAHGCGLGLFGASTGAAAALFTAAQRPNLVGAVVSRGGRPDLAARVLSVVHVPTLLIVGSKDTAVIRINREAMALMKCVSELKIIPGATHLFEEPGTLSEVAMFAKEWFLANIAYITQRE